MTLNDFLTFLSTHPAQVAFYFSIVPFAALLAGWMERDEAHLPPWNYLYSAMLYLVAIPAIGSVALTAYRWLFERPSIMEADLLLHVLPVGSFIVTVLIVRRQVALPGLPGFGRLGGMMLMIAAALIILWAIDRTRIVVFSLLKIQYLVAAFLVLLLLLRRGWRKVTA